MGTPWTVTDGAGATIKLDGNGNVTIIGKTITFQAPVITTQSGPSTQKPTFEVLGF